MVRTRTAIEIEFPRDLKGLVERAEKSDVVQKGQGPAVTGPREWLHTEKKVNLI